ncbi:AraC family transcriptional regulator [Noviherbaspirillum denitrificans]|uniref:AraC family transcriptional regulator n=1 Tax=Noviherbaspirillum denitrificans TaxID=1968433 RepID=A0A254TJN5_9BURK|nr:AraC family transcriptional regulator [Noviherbaspirillum denitrificans]OWW20813.1 AraC family transcriptional regulator [Noviherbaspirillum denitrificans]
MPSTPSSVIDQASGIVAVAYLQPLLEAAAARGVNADKLARAAGQMLSPLPESVSADAYLRLLDTGAEFAHDPHFGLHVGECVKLGAYNVYGLILLSCRDFGQALQQTLRFEGLAHDLGRSALRIDGPVAEYRWDSAMPDASRHLVESVFAGIQVIGSWLAGRELPRAVVAFRHAAPEDCSEHRRIFGENLRFNAEANVARFDSALLAWPVRNADVGLYPVLQQHAEQLLREKQRVQADAGIVGQVRGAIVRNLAQDRVRLASIAEELNITPRTLQRKLSDAGATFQQVLDNIRHELALDYLARDRLSLAEIAFLLGYQEQSSFCHAFKEWTGLNPGAYRDSL